MSRTVTLSELRNEVREYCDCILDPHVTNTFLNSCINRAIPEYIDLVTSVFGTDYYTTSATFETDGSSSYDLEDDFYKLVGVDVQTSGDRFQTVGRFNFHNRNQSNTDVIVYPWATNTEYRVMGDLIYFSPAPPTGKTMKIWYVPTSVVLEDNAATFDFINGWEEYVILFCAIRVKIKKEEWKAVDKLGLLKTEKMAMILQAAENRDSANEEMIHDVYGRNYTGEI